VISKKEKIGKERRKSVAQVSEQTYCVDLRRKHLGSMAIHLGKAPERAEVLLLLRLLLLLLLVHDGLAMLAL
jgi:hypothetical protein